MSRPVITILNRGGIGAPQTESNLGNDAYSAPCTVALIEYNTDTGKKGMLVDTSCSADWPKIKYEIEKRCGLENITHVLITHWDQDHAQNLRELPQRICVSGAGTARIGTPDYGNTASLYSDLEIETPDVKAQPISQAHSRDDTLFIVNSENMGKVIFLGDLIFVPMKEFPTSQLVNFDTFFSINPMKKYLTFKKILSDHPDVNAFVVGHSGTILSKEDFEKEIRAMEEGAYKEFLEKYISDLEKNVKEYSAVLK